jgi:Plant transposon protein
MDIKKKYFRMMMTQSDAIQVSHLHEEKHGVAGMIGSLDCMHVGWKNCLVAWQGQGKEKSPTITLEAYADNNIWIRHASFGYTGILNDISIWEQSPLLNAFIDGTFMKEIDFKFVIGDKTFDNVWFLADGIYPKIAHYAKTLEEAVNEERRMYVHWQEGCWKSIECASIY